MRAALKDAQRPEALDGGKDRDVAWGAAGVMTEDILPDRPADRRTRRRMRALRAMDRLGLMSEDNLIPTLARRPELRWLADERGARWDVLAELGRIGRRGAFERAVEWALEARPRPEEARAYVLDAGSRAHHDGGGAGPDARGTAAASRTRPRVRRLRGAARKEERRR